MITNPPQRLPRLTEPDHDVSKTDLTKPIPERKDSEEETRAHGESCSSQPEAFARVRYVPVAPSGEVGSVDEVELRPTIMRKKKNKSVRWTEWDGVSEGGKRDNLRIYSRVPSIVHIPADTPIIPHGLLERLLTIGRVLHLGFMFDFYRSRFVAQHEFGELDGVRDHVLNGQDDAAVPGGGIGTEDHEEVGEAVHGRALVRLGTSPRVHFRDEVDVVATGDFEGVQPFRRVEAVG